MRAPSQSFRGELDAFRKRLMMGPDDDWRRLFVEVLDRWGEHADVEKMWMKVKAKVPTALAGEFIAAVLLRRKLVNEIDSRMEQLPEIEGKVRSSTKRNLKEGRYREIAAANGWLADVKELRTTVLGRERTGSRKHFMLGWSKIFQDVCGQPLDEVVAFFTEIAFDGGPVSTEAVRGARKATTRAERQNPPR
jgi:hypothetical protein